MFGLNEARREKDDFFLTDRHSPLTAEQKRAFTGLNYYPENPALRLNLKLERTANPEPVLLATSTGEEREYIHAGQISFSVDGQNAVLQVYEADYGFFLPFSDETAAEEETYGAGRYLEPEEGPSGTLSVDFNLAYNPYCAYNERWACPLPPSANRLKIRIEAGEKNSTNNFFKKMRLFFQPFSGKPDMRPFVFINVAVTADGKMDTLERKGSGISSDADRARVMELRAGADAVMVGGHTLIDEDPKLSVKPLELRLKRQNKNLPENPMKVGITTRMLPRLDGDFMTSGTAQRVIFTTTQADPKQVNALENHGAQVFVLGEKRVNLEQALETLHALGVRQLMVEGGGTLNFEMLRQKLVDEIYLYIAPKIFGGQTAPTLADGKGLAEFAGLNLKLLDAQVLDETGGVLIRYQCLGM